MKKIIIFLCFLKISSLSLAQDYRVITTLNECMGKPCHNINYYTQDFVHELFIQKTKRKFSYVSYSAKQDSAATKRIINFYKNGNVAYIAEAFNDELNGKLIYFTKRGRLDLILEYSTGKISGVLFSRTKDSLEKYKALTGDIEAPASQDL